MDTSSTVGIEESAKANRSSGSMQRMGRRLGQLNPVLMAWVSGLNIAFAIASYDRLYQDWELHAIVGMTFAGMAILLNTIKPPTGD